MNAVAEHVEAAYNVLCSLFSGSEYKAALEASPRGKSVASAGRANNGTAKRGRMVAKSCKKPAVDAPKSQSRKGD